MALRRPHEMKTKHGVSVLVKENPTAYFVSKDQPQVIVQNGETFSANGDPMEAPDWLFGEAYNGLTAEAKEHLKLKKPSTHK